jgi:aryl-alcohol dehydrogenase-like predicted oxidoreductase
MGVIARMPLQFGLLTGKFNKDSTFPASDHRSFRLTPGILKQSLDDLEPVWSMAEKYPINLASFALSFILSHPEVSTVIPGIKTPEQAIANTQGIISLSKEDSATLHNLFNDRFSDLLEIMK